MPKTLSKQDTTRLLLTLWDLNAAEAPVKKGEVTRKVQRKGQKSNDYKAIFSQLEKDGAIAISGQRVQEVSLSPKGVQMLGQGLKSSDFNFESAIGARTANALLNWMRQMDSSSVSSANGNGKAKQAAIDSYDEFKQAALDVYDRLNRDYNMGNLVPIYRIRREIGDRVSRPQFSEWLFSMQSDDIFQLLEESVEDSAPDKIEDSVTTKLGKLRCYAKRLAH